MLIYALKSNGNYEAETKVPKVKYSNVRKDVWSMVWIRRNNVYALLGEFQESQFLGEDDCHPKLYSCAKNGRSLTYSDH